MKPRKEHYRRKLPHYQQPGQQYSVTCILHGAMPKGAMAKYSLQLEAAKNRYQLLLQNSDAGELDFPKSDLIFDLESRSPESRSPESRSPESRSPGKLKSPDLQEARKEYQIALRKYRLAYDKILNKSNLPGIFLTKTENRKTIEEALHFWEGKRLTSHAWCIMSNHFHWVLSVFEKNENGKPVYLQDILHSIKLFTARQINDNESRKGNLWEHESFDTTIRNERHFMNVVNYVISNPISAGLITNWHEWPGTFLEEGHELAGNRTFLSPI